MDSAMDAMSPVPANQPLTSHINREMPLSLSQDSIATVTMQGYVIVDYPLPAVTVRSARTNTTTSYVGHADYVFLDVVKNMEFPAEDEAFCLETEQFWERAAGRVVIKVTAEQMLHGDSLAQVVAETIALMKGQYRCVLFVVYRCREHS
jgi:hypothetical protein